MQVHIHDNNSPSRAAHNCLSEIDLTPGKVITLHMHAGDCVPCPKGHCHGGTINLLEVDGDLYVVLEGVRPPDLITADETRPHSAVAHN